MQFNTADTIQNFISIIHLCDMQHNANESTEYDLIYEKFFFFCVLQYSQMIYET